MGYICRLRDREISRMMVVCLSRWSDCVTIAKIKNTGEGQVFEKRF